MMPTLPQIVANCRGKAPRRREGHELAGLHAKVVRVGEATENLRRRIWAAVSPKPPMNRRRTEATAEAEIAKRRNADARRARATMKTVDEARSSLFQTLDELYREARALGWTPPRT